MKVIITCIFKAKHRNANWKLEWKREDFNWKQRRSWRNDRFTAKQKICSVVFILGPNNTGHALIFYIKLVQNITVTHPICTKPSFMCQWLPNNFNLSHDVISNKFVLSPPHLRWNVEVESSVTPHSESWRSLSMEDPSDPASSALEEEGEATQPFSFLSFSSRFSSISQGWERRLRFSFCLVISSFFLHIFSPKENTERTREHWQHTLSSHQ